MFVGAGGCPAATLVVAALVGLALACGGASALNHVIDRDIDQLMGERTRPARRRRAECRRRARSSSASRCPRSRFVLLARS